MLTEHDMNDMLVEHLFFDYNSMIHPCAHQVLENSELNTQCQTADIENEIIQHTLGYTRYVIDMLKPKYVYIMIDGVAPRAKINQQRERRYKSHFFKNLHPVNNPVEWDTNNITPGTGFMIKLKQQLQQFTEAMVRDNTRVEKIYISDSDEKGEGEHKMMKVIDHITNKQEQNKSKIFIYGLDADLIMLSLLSQACEQIVLLRDNTFNHKLKESQQTFTYLDIKQLQSAIYEEVRVLCNDSNFDYPKRNVIADYIFLCFLMGNDFLHHVPSLMIKENGINALMKFYISALRNSNYKPLVSLNQSVPLPQRVCWQMLKDIFKGLSGSEDYFFRSVYSVYKTNQNIYKDIDLSQYLTDNPGNPSNTGNPGNPGNPDNTDSTKTLGTEKCGVPNSNNSIDKDNKCLHFCFQDSIKFNEPGYKSRYYSYYGITNVEQACHNYLTGLLWVWGYYNGHEHDNWTWFYQHHETPFVSDLYTHLQSYTYKMDDRDLMPSQPNSPLEQLMMVLPRQSLLGILNEINPCLCAKMTRIFGTNSPVLYKHYPTQIVVDMLHKEYLWQSKLFLDPYEREFLQLLL